MREMKGVMGGVAAKAVEGKILTWKTMKNLLPKKSFHPLHLSITFLFVKPLMTNDHGWCSLTLDAGVGNVADSHNAQPVNKDGILPCHWYS